MQSVTQPKLRMKLTNYVNSEDFSLYVNFARKVGFYDSNSKAWNISLAKLQLYSKADICADYNYVKYLPLNSEVKEFFDEYCKEIETATTLTNDLTVDGNYVVIPSRSPLYEKFEYMKSHFIMKYKTFDRTSGHYVQNEVPLYTVKPSQILLFRGLFSVLKDLSKRFGINANINNMYIEDVTQVNIPTSVAGKDLRVYQLDAVRRAISSIAEIRGALIQMPTGSGKTLVGEALIKVLTDIGKLKTAFIIVESQDLLNQWAEELAKVFGREKIGKLYQNEQSVKEGGINVVTYQSLYKVVRTYLTNVRHSLDVNENVLFTIYKDADFILVDEAHHLPADSISTILTVNSKAVRVGLSATPFREDNRDLLLHSLTSVPVVRYKMTDEIFRKLNVLVPIKVVNVLVDFLRMSTDDDRAYEIDAPDDEDIRPSKIVKMSSRIISEETVQKLALYIALKLHERYKLPVIIHSPYARPLREMSDRFGIPLLEGQKTDAEREVLLQKLRNNEIEVVLATTLVDEGIDIPPLVGLVMMLPGASRVKLVQRMGRLTRPHKGKDMAFAYLFDYSKSKLGALSIIFERQKKKRDDFMRKEGYEVSDVHWKDLKL